MSLPLYKVIASEIKRRIDESIWTDVLPSEKQLCQTFDVSRITIRNAIQILVDEGLISKRQGLGMFIEKESLPLNRIESSRLFTGSGNDYVNLDIKRNIYPNLRVVRILNLKPMEQVAEITRLLFLDDEPAAYLTIWIPEKYKLDEILVKSLGSGLVIPALNSLGVNVTHTAVTMEPEILRSRHTLLNLEKGSPILLVNRVAYSDTDEPILYIEHIISGKKSKKLLNIQTHV